MYHMQKKVCDNNFGNNFVSSAKKSCHFILGTHLQYLQKETPFFIEIKQNPCLGRAFSQNSASGGDDFEGWGFVEYRYKLLYITENPCIINHSDTVLISSIVALCLALFL